MPIAKIHNADNHRQKRNPWDGFTWDNKNK